MLSTWLRSVSLPAAWLSLDRRDSDLVTFLTYFVAAVHTLFPQSCEQTQATMELPQLPAIRDIANSLVNEISALRQDFILVLDDYHLIRKPEVHKLVLALVYRLPVHVHLVISSRSDPPFPFARLRAQGRVAEVRTENLRFNAEEAQALLEQDFGASVTPEATELLVKRTEGWAVGLQLAALSMRGHSDPVAFARAFRDNINRHVLEYLTSDVLTRQPETIQNFLLRTSILDQFSASLGDALSHDDGVLGSVTDTKRLDSAAILRRLEQSNLFVSSLDDNGEWYRYHDLFRDMLREQLTRTCGREFVAQLHAKASTWFASHGLIEEALQHALAAGDTESAATLVERYKHDWLNNEQWGSLDRALSLLPDDVVQARPALLLVKAFVWQVQGRVAHIMPIVDKAEALLEASTISDASRQELRGEIDLLRSFAASSTNDFHASLALAERALQRLPVEHVFMRGTALYFLCTASQYMGRFKVAVRTIQHELDSGQTQHSTYVLRILFALAAIHLYEGRLHETATYAANLLNMAAQHQRPLSIGWARFALGLCWYEQNDLDAAAIHFEANVRQAHSIHVEAAYGSFMGLALTFQARGESARANETAQALSDFDLEQAGRLLLREAQSFRARLALLQGDVAGAVRWVETTDDDDNLYGQGYAESPGVTRAHVLIAAGTPEHLRAAMKQLDQLLATARSMHDVRWQIPILALQALALHAQGKTSDALDALESALNLAKPGAFIRTFVDLGSPLAELLEHLVRQNRQSAYAARLLRAFPLSPEKQVRDSQTLPAGATPRMSNANVDLQLIEPLTERELEVLRLLTQRLSNKEIAGILFISEGTVKNHMHNILHKLGVKRRLEAIHRAHALGLGLLAPA